MEVETMQPVPDPEATDWKARANCMGVDPDLFFPERGMSTREAKEVCRGCVVREDCLEYALANGEPFFSYPPVQETVDATLAEVMRCTREGIRINTFMLDATTYLKGFVEKLTQMNRGRAFFTTPETLGSFVLVDFIEQKRAMRGARHLRGA